MKLIIAIVQDEDASRLVSSLMNEGFGVTKLATTGGFLRAGNTTLLVGVEDERFDGAMGVMDIADLFAQNMGVSGEGYKQVKETIRNLKPEGSEPKVVLKYKTALRAAEALAACRFMGIPSERVHFLNLPFKHF